MSCGREEVFGLQYVEGGRFVQLTTTIHARALGCSADPVEWNTVEIVRLRRKCHEKEKVIQEYGGEIVVFKT